MGFEIIKHLQAPPNRIYDTLKLFEKLGAIEKEKAYGFLQPDFISKGQQAIKSTLDILLHFGLAKANPRKKSFILVDTSYLSSYDNFRLKMQQVMLGAKEEHDDNFLLSQVTAWYAAKNHEVVTMERTEFERLFHLNLYEGAKARIISERDSIYAWGLWASFLGFGKEYNPEIASGRRLIPNAKGRILPLLPHILKPGEVIPVDEFIERLGDLCPELDGGSLYKKCYQAVHSRSDRDASLSLMLSTALYQLNAENIISVINEADAMRKRQMFPSQSYINQLSHICLKKTEAVE
jgi:hypothetical protein